VSRVPRTAACRRLPGAPRGSRRKGQAAAGAGGRARRRPDRTCGAPATRHATSSIVARLRTNQPLAERALDVQGELSGQLVVPSRRRRIFRVDQHDPIGQADGGQSVGTISVVRPPSYPQTLVDRLLDLDSTRCGVVEDQDGGMISSVRAWPPLALGRRTGCSPAPPTTVSYRPASLEDDSSPPPPGRLANLFERRNADDRRRCCSGSRWRKNGLSEATRSWTAVTRSIARARVPVDPDRAGV